jgi:hypothetical protein
MIENAESATAACPPRPFVKSSRATVVGHDIGLMDEAQEMVIPAIVAFID